MFYCIHWWDKNKRYLLTVYRLMSFEKVTKQKLILPLRIHSSTAHWCIKSFFFFRNICVWWKMLIIDFFSFVDLLCFCSVLYFCLCARLFICALWSPAGKGLTSWLSFVVSNCEFVTFPLDSWVRCGTWLYRFLIFAPLLTLRILLLWIRKFSREFYFRETSHLRSFVKI